VQRAPLAPWLLYHQPVNYITIIQEFGAING
jgi:hypothetical protein